MSWLQMHDLSMGDRRKFYLCCTIILLNYFSFMRTSFLIFTRGICYDTYEMKYGSMAQL